MNPITTIRLQSLSSADQSQVPVTFGQVFKAGDMMPTDGLVADKVPLQVDVKATHADGSVRHAILSAMLPKLKSGETLSLPLTKAAKQSGSFSMAGLTLPDAKVKLTIAGEVYTASLQDQGLSGLIPWLVGPVVVEGFAWSPLKNAQGSVHPVLKVRFGVRYYLDTKQARVEAVVENCNTWLPGRRFVYDAEFSVSGKVAYSATGLTHYHHSRWRQVAWTATEPQLHIMHEAGYLIASKAVSNYDQSILPAENILAGMGQALSAANTGPMKIGTVQSYMGMTGGRGDIGPLPDWCVNYLLSQDKRAKDLMIANAEGSGSWSIHLRDEKTGIPLRTDNDANRLITTHPNASNQGPLPVPRFPTADDAATPYADDVAHEPSLAYLPYLVTGDYYYLEELQFWVVWNPLGTAPGSNGYGQGLLRWHQIRGQAWALRTLGEATYITPDTDPLKAYFAKQLDNNLNWYADVYVKGNPNSLGIIDGSGEAAAEVGTAMAPWQDDYMTWAFGYLKDLGFEKARPIVEWKGKFPVGRLVGDGYCPIMSAPYQFVNLRTTSGKVVGSFGELYKATFGGDTVPDDLGYFKSFPDKGRFIDLPCGSQQQADYMNALNGNWGWQLGRMNGLSDSVIGPSANLQPALAAAVDAGVKDAEKAMQRFAARTLKPNWSQNPQWNIIPRNMAQPTPAQYVPPQPAATSQALAVGQKPSDSVAGEWIKVGDENGRIKVENGSYVRYGVPGKAYRYAQVKGEFTATNEAFGGDPVPQVVKVVEAFKVAPPKQLGKLKLGSNKKLAKLDVTITIFDPYALKEVKVLSQTMNSSGSATLSDSTFTIGQVYGVRVADEKGNLLDTKLPILKAVK